MIRAHISAIADLLTGLTVYISRADDIDSTPYVVLHPDQGTADPSSYGLDVNTRLWRFQTTCVGVSPVQAQWLAEKVETALLNVTPAITGRKASPIAKDHSLIVERDEDLAEPLYMARDLWTVLTIPA